MANQARLRSYRNRPVYQYGVQVPRDHPEAVWLDEKAGDTLWQDSEDLELKQLDDYDTFIDQGKGAPVPKGHTLIPCHICYACKHDGRRKSRFVARGHRTGTPVDSTYSGVASILIIITQRITRNYSATLIFAKSGRRRGRFSHSPFCAH